MKLSGAHIIWSCLVEQGVDTVFGIPGGNIAPLVQALRRHPRFRSHGVGKCEWDGAVWPFATSQTLNALANVLRRYQQSYVTKQDYFDALRVKIREEAVVRNKAIYLALGVTFRLFLTSLTPSVSFAIARARARPDPHNRPAPAHFRPGRRRARGRRTTGGRRPRSRAPGRSAARGSGARRTVP